MTKGKIALQLYSVRDDCAKDFFNTIRQVAAIGYERVEFAGYFGKTAKRNFENFTKIINY